MLRPLQTELLLYGRRMNQINMSMSPTGSSMSNVYSIIYVCACVCVCVCVHVCVCVCMCVCMCVCICMCALCITVHHCMCACICVKGIKAKEIPWCNYPQNNSSYCGIQLVIGQSWLHIYLKGGPYTTPPRFFIVTLNVCMNLYKCVSQY